MSSLSPAPTTRPVSLQVELGPLVFSFDSFDDWVRQASRIWRFHGVSADRTVCVDQRGRLCGWGEHFMRARDEGAFPIAVYHLRADLMKES